MSGWRTLLLLVLFVPCGKGLFTNILKDSSWNNVVFLLLMVHCTAASVLAPQGNWRLLGGVWALQPIATPPRRK